MIDKETKLMLLRYELRSSFIVRLLGFYSHNSKFGNKINGILGKFFAKKVKRKLARYESCTPKQRIDLCHHNFVAVDNEVATGGYICTKCKMIVSNISVYDVP